MSCIRHQIHFIRHSVSKKTYILKCSVCKETARYESWVSWEGIQKFGIFPSTGRVLQEKETMQ